MSETTITQGTGYIFTDLGFGPEEAQNLLLRSQVRSAIIIWYKDSGLKQASAAKRLGIAQPRFNQLLKGKIKDFSLDALVNIASSAGLHLCLNVEPFPKPKQNINPTKSSKLPIKKPSKAA
jgi:predicted XRE-type DNA-binding protein